MDFPKVSIDVESLVRLAQDVGVLELHLFGSVLREDFGPESDIDLLVSFSQDRHYSLFDVFEIRDRFASLLGRRVDLVEMEGLVNPYRRENILKNSRKIYAA